MTEAIPEKCPDWFADHIRHPFEHRTVTFAGCPIHYQLRHANDKPHERPGLILVHGNGAHSRWWDHIAPAFTDQFNVVALDLSGAGDSGHRDAYSPDLFAGEIGAVSSDAGLHKPILVGHSFGGTLARITTWLHPQKFSGLVLADSIISANKGQRRNMPAPSGRTRYYASLQAAMLRFRLRPPQPCQNRFILDHIARHSVHQTAQGWCFKADQSLFAKLNSQAVNPDGEATSSVEIKDIPDAVSIIKAIRVPVSLIYGDRSRFFDEAARRTAESLIHPDYLYPIKDAYHHLFLDQPVAFIDTLQQVLERILTRPTDRDDKSQEPPS